MCPEDSSVSREAGVTEPRSARHARPLATMIRSASCYAAEHRHDHRLDEAARGARAAVRKAPRVPLPRLDL